MNNREDWWEYTKRIIRSYPALARKAESVGDMPCTPAYGTGGGHGGTNSNPVERAVVDRLTDKEQRRYDAVRAAISETGRMKHGHQRMELIDRELHKIPNEKVRTLAAQHISYIRSSNRRDFRF